jgi:hypothetical protein
LLPFDYPTKPSFKRVVHSETCPMAYPRERKRVHRHHR